MNTPDRTRCAPTGKPRAVERKRERDTGILPEQLSVQDIDSAVDPRPRERLLQDEERDDQTKTPDGSDASEGRMVKD